MFFFVFLIVLIYIGISPLPFSEKTLTEAQRDITFNLADKWVYSGWGRVARVRIGILVIVPVVAQFSCISCLSV